MRDSSLSKNKPAYRISLFLLFLTFSLLVFFINLTFTDVILLKTGIILKIVLMAVFLISAFLLYRSQSLNIYWKVFFTFFIASIAIFLALYLGKWGLRVLNLENNTLNGVTLNKFLEDLVIILSIIILSRVTGRDLASIYLKRGKLKLGLIIGVTSFLLLYLTSALQAAGQNISFGKFFSLTPWILIIILADGFMEELLFRGLFLKKFESFLGAKLSIILTALIYSLAHLQVTYTSELLFFLAILFILGVIWGYIIQKTDGLWGSVLFHAGADSLIIMQALISFGVTS